MQKNLTVKLDEHLIIKAKQKAVGSGKSLSQVVAEFLRKFSTQDSDHEKTKKKALMYLDKGFNLGGGKFNREELYDRPSMLR